MGQAFDCIGLTAMVQSPMSWLEYPCVVFHVFASRACPQKLPVRFDIDARELLPGRNCGCCGADLPLLVPSTPDRAHADGIIVVTRRGNRGWRGGSPASGQQPPEDLSGGSCNMSRLPACCLEDAEKLHFREYLTLDLCLRTATGIP